MFKGSGPEDAADTLFVPRQTIIDRDIARKSERWWQDVVAIARLCPLMNVDFRAMDGRPQARPGGRHQRRMYQKTQDRYEYAFASQSRYVGT